MKKNNWGRIINITSIAGIEISGPSSFNASKAALTAYSRSVGRQLALEKKNIVMTAVAPGVIETELTRTILKNKINIIKKDIPMKRLGNVNEIANIVYWLASDENTYLTGQQIIADGGYTIV